MQRFLSFLVLITIVGCSSSQQGIRIRAQSPTIDEAFRKLSLAITVDGFEVERIDSKQFAIETKWRDMKERERGVGEKTERGSVKVAIKLSPRGQMFDVIITPSIQIGDFVAIPAVGHPLNEKWQRIVNSIVQKETREED